MPEPIGEAFVRILPDFTAFRAAVRQGVSAAAPAIAAQTKAAQEATRASGLVLPSSVRSVTAEAAAAQVKLGNATKATNEQLKKLRTTQIAGAGSTGRFRREVQEAERDTGRFTRGTLAATAASTGFFRAVSFASGAFLIGATIGSTIASAVSEFRNMTVVGAQTAAIIKATGEAANVTAAQLDTLAKAQLRVTGVDDEVIKQGANVLLTFRKIRNEVGAGNDIFTRATKDLLDIAAVFHTNVTSSAIQLGKALQDPVRGVTALRRSGITLSQSQRDLIKRLVETGRILTAQKIILGEVERQVGGTAEAVGRTLPGRLNILKEEAKNSLGEYVKRISESQRATQLFDESVAGVGNVMRTLKSVVATLGPPLLNLAEALGKTVQFLGGASTFLAAVIAFKGIKTAVALATTAQAAYTRAVLVGTGAITAQEAALLANTNAFRANTVAQLAGAEVSAGNTAIKIGQVEASAIGAGAALKGTFARALTAVGGTLGATALGVGALAFATNKLVNSLDRGRGSINATRDALNGLAGAIKNLESLRSGRAQARLNVTTAQAEVQGAERALQVAQRALAGSQGQPGSLLRTAQEARVTQAAIDLRDAEERLRTAQAALVRSNDLIRQSEARKAAAARDTTKAINDQIRAITQQAADAAAITGALQPGLPTAGLAISTFNDALAQLAKTSGLSPALVNSLKILENILGRLPNRKQVTIAVRVAAQGGTTRQILAALGILDPTAGGARAEENRLRGATLTPPSATIFQQIRGARALLKTDQDRLAAAQKTLRTKRDELNVAKDAVRTAREQLQQAEQARIDAQQALADARQAAIDAQQNLRDTIAAARQEINQAVTDAKANLDSLGQAIASALGQAGIATKNAGGALGAQFRRLRDQIIAGQGGPETQRAAAQVAARIQGQAGNATNDFQRRLADLTDALNRGKLTLPQFNKALANILKGVDFNDLRRRFGSAFVNTLVDEIKALRQQAALILGGPQRPGGGNPPALVRPLQAVADASRQIAQARRDEIDSRRQIVSAQRALVRSNQDVADAERALRRAQARETKANTAAIKANTKASQALAKVIADQRSQRRAPRRPNGQAAQDSNQMTRNGADLP